MSNRHPLCVMSTWSRRHHPVILFSFMTYNWIFNKVNRLVPQELIAVPGYLSPPQFSSIFSLRCSILWTIICFSILFFYPLNCLFFEFTASNYPLKNKYIRKRSIVTHKVEPKHMLFKNKHLTHYFSVILHPLTC